MPEERKPNRNRKPRNSRNKKPNHHKERSHSPAVMEEGNGRDAVEINLFDIQTMKVPELIKMAEDDFGLSDDLAGLRKHELIFEMLKMNARNGGCDAWSRDFGSA